VLFFKKLSLFKRFTLFSLIAFVSTGLILSILISDHIKNEQIMEFNELTSLTIDTTITPYMTSQELEKPFDESMSQNMDIKFTEIMKPNNFLEMHIWNTNSVLIYSTNHNIQNMLYTNKNILMSVLRRGKSSYNITYHNKTSVATLKYTDIITVYVPIINNQHLSGVFEVYIPYDEVKQHIDAINRLIFLVMFSGLLILYLFLLRVIFTASNTLIKQNRSLQEQKDELEKAYLTLNSTYKNTVTTLSNAVDARDPYTAGHSERVAEISLQIGNALGLRKVQLDKIEMSALFHDIGKLGVPDNVLLKPGKLTKDEFQKIKEHPSIGVSILKNIDFLAETLPIILHHHEKYDGSGYPDGISGNEIPFESRIICIADTYDAMTSDRPYRKELSHEEAIAEIIKFRGIQFDPEVTDAFLTLSTGTLTQKNKNN
jgi:putative nucleotidyltransferase with HDIG domain